MIKSTFIFIPGIGKKTEELLWKKGILTWNDLKDRGHIIGLSRNKRMLITDYLDRAENALYKHDASFFAEYLPQREYWRIYKDFRDKTIFLDIETTGLSLYYDKITLIGTCNGHNIKFFMKDCNLEDALDYLKDYDLIVTFNGKLFDVPFIESEFPEARIPPIHIDLRYLLRSLGVTGPLKKIEEKLEITRPKDVQEINGREAAVLWSRFVKGDDKALETLLLYNVYDTTNLQSLMDLCYQRKIEEIKSKINHNHSQQKLIGTSGNRKTDHHLDAFIYFDVPKITSKYDHNGLFEAYLNNELLFRINRKKIERTDVELDNLIEEIRKKNRDPIAVGIDLKNMGINVSSERETITHDELDALTSALVGYFYLAGNYEAIGNIDEEYLIIPAFNGKYNTYEKGMKSP